MVVAGYSAGGFGTAILANDIVESFPNTNNFTIVVDGAILDIPHIADIMKNKWGSPEKIWRVMKTENIVVDNFQYLSEKYGESVKLLFTISLRDNMLTKYQNYIDTKNFEMTKESFDKMQQQIKFSAEEIKKLPQSALYIWEIMDPSTEVSKNGNGTLHTSLMLG